jgi:hypothetical protein
MKKTTASRLTFIGKALFMASALTVMLVACKKGDTGPAGPAGSAGPAGPAGPGGPAGSPNVIYSSWMTPKSQGNWRDTIHNTKVARYFTKSSSAFSQDVLDKAVVLSYVCIPDLGGEIYQLPVVFPHALDVDGNLLWHAVAYRHAVTLNKIAFYLYSPEGHVDVPIPAADDKNKFRYIIIPGGVQAPASAGPDGGGRLSSGHTVEQLRRMSYSEVKALYNIPDDGSSK